MKLKTADRKLLGRAAPPQDLQVLKSQGSFLYGSRGKRYIDFNMGWCVGNLGWGFKEIKSKIKNFKGPDYVSPQQIYKPWVELGDLLAKITPGQLRKSFRATGGTEAVEFALQAAMTHTKRQKFISIEEAFHGDSVLTRNVGSPGFGDWYKEPFQCYRIKPPLTKKAADRAEKWLQKKDVAAFIMEPVICNRGVLIPEQEFMTRMQELCKKYGTLLIMDEVATGFGRTGRLFASEHFQIEPDILCLAKAITGGTEPMGATVMTEEVAQSVQYENSYYSTYGWHPRATEAALANIRYLLRHRKQIETHTRVLSQYFSERLHRMPFPRGTEIRVLGLAIGVDLGSEEYGRHLVDRAMEEGLVLSEGEKGITLFPALNVRLKTAKEGLDLLEKCVSLLH